MRVGKGHGDVAVVVEHGLIANAPLGCGSCCPCAEVLIYGIAPFVDLVKHFRLGNRTPVNLGNEDRIGLDNGNLLLELIDEISLALLYAVAINLTIIAAIPSGIYVNGIGDVLSRDGIGFIVGIARLVACTWYPDDALETVGADEVNDRLEIVVQSLGVALVVHVLDVDGLVGKLKAYLTRILAHCIVLGNDIPYLHQILLIVVADLKIRRTHSRRAHDNILAMSQSLLSQRNIERTHIGLQASRIEMLDVGLATNTIRLNACYGIVVAVVVGPCRFEMQTENVAVGNLESRELFLEILETAFATIIVIAPAPTSAVEPGTRGVHNTVEHNMVAVCVHKPATLDMQRGQRLFNLR